MNNSGDCGNAYHEPGTQPGRRPRKSRHLPESNEERGGFNLDKVTIEQDISRESVDLPASEAPCRARTTQIEVAPFEASFLTHFGVPVHAEMAAAPPH